MSTQTHTAKLKPTLLALVTSASLFAGLGAVVWAATSGVTRAHAAEVGQPAPDVDLPGTPVAAKLADLRGRYVYVDFWASWCGPCKLSFPWMSALQARYQPTELTVLTINLDKQRRDADRFVQQNPAAFAVAYDPAGESAKRFALKTMPSSYLIGPDGQVLWAHRGFTLDERAELDRQIDRIVKK
jgi:cytochrome c biogenesis protein CcmG/thiol:disulfide interchange protein DsbE